jgi:flagella synthesis protein FlgN
MTNSPAATDFTSRLSAERDGLQSLVTLLETEQKALIEGNTEQLLALSENKTRAVRELSTLANERKIVLQNQEVLIKARGIIGWLQTYAPRAVPAWQDIQKLVEQMQNLNRTNGVLIQTKMRNNQKALSVLLNVSQSAQGLYGADGQTHITSSRRILGSV